MDPQVQSLALQLAEAAVRNTAGAIVDRIAAAKARRRHEETIAELEQIVSDLITDKAELLRVAQAFEEELVAQRISADDVRYITSTLVPVVRELMDASTGSSPSGRTASQPQQAVELLERILSPETITVLQLLGFNFKKAIGEPLTELVGAAIRTKAPADATIALELQRIATQREATLLEIARDEESFQRFRKMTGQ